jgi:acyl-CoA dehydrogenase
MRVALGTADVFRTTVGAAALGLRAGTRRAIRHVKQRVAFGKPLADFQLTQARIADMATAIDAAALLVYRAAGRATAAPDRVTRVKPRWPNSWRRRPAQQVHLTPASNYSAHAASWRASRSSARIARFRALRIYEGHERDSEDL